MTIAHKILDLPTGTLAPIESHDTVKVTRWEWNVGTRYAEVVLYDDVCISWVTIDTANAFYNREGVDPIEEIDPRLVDFLSDFEA